MTLEFYLSVCDIKTYCTVFFSYRSKTSCLTLYKWSIWMNYFCSEGKYLAILFNKIISVTPKQVDTELYVTPDLTNLLSNDFLQDLFHSNRYYFSCYSFNHVIFWTGEHSKSSLHTCKTCANVITRA